MEIKLDVVEEMVEFILESENSDENNKQTKVQETMKSIVRFEEKLVTNDLYEFCKKQECSDMGNAIVLNALYGKYFKHNGAFGWLFYNGKCWDSSALAECALQVAVTKAFEFRKMLEPSKDILAATKGSRSNISNCIALFQKLPSIICPNSRFDSIHHLMNVSNGVINLKTGELYPHKPEYLFTTCSPVEYKVDANYTRWVEFLDTVILHHSTNEEVKNFIKQSVGYSATGETKEEYLWYMQGQPRAGKGTFIHAISNVLGNVFESRNFSTFTNKRNGNDQGFDLAGLSNKRFVSASESDSKTVMNEAVVKNITGRDPITCAFKGKDSFTWQPIFKIWLSSNFYPKGDLDDSSFWGRIRLILFSTSFLGKEDKNLKESFTEKSFLEGVLKWMVEGATEYYNAPKGIQTPQVFYDALEEYREGQDTVAMWINEDWVPSTIKTFTPTTQLYQAYRSWCEDNEYPEVGKRKLFASLDAKGIKKEAINIPDKLSPTKYKRIDAIANYDIKDVLVSFFVDDNGKIKKTE